MSVSALTSIRQKRGERPGPFLGGGQQHRPATLQNRLGSSLDGVEHASVASKHDHCLLQIVKEHAAEPQSQLLRVHLVTDGGVKLRRKVRS